MNYIQHISISDWGTSYSIIHPNGEAFARAYMYHGDKKAIYLDMLSVNHDSRGCGMGTELQELRENTGRKLGCKYSYLWVKKGTWMRKWYARRGYKYYSPNKEEKAIWLRKRL